MTPNRSRCMFYLPTVTPCSLIIVGYWRLGRAGLRMPYGPGAPQQSLSWADNAF